MKERPKRRDEPVIDRTMAQQIFWMGLYTMTLCITFLRLPYFRTLFRFDENPIYFLTAFYALFIFSGVFNSFNARTNRINLLSHLRKNPTFILIMLIVSAVQLVMIYYGGRVFRTAGLTPSELRMVILMAFSVIPADQIRKFLFKIFKKRKKGREA